MKKYDKDVVARRFRERRVARKRDAGRGSDKFINLFLVLFVVGAVILAAVIFMALY